LTRVPSSVISPGSVGDIASNGVGARQETIASAATGRHDAPSRRTIETSGGTPSLKVEQGKTDGLINGA
jgi:hypothetical protein